MKTKIAIAKSGIDLRILPKDQVDDFMNTHTVLFSEIEHGLQLSSYQEDYDDEQVTTKYVTLPTTQESSHQWRRKAKTVATNSSNKTTAAALTNSVISSSPSRANTEKTIRKQLVSPLKISKTDSKATVTTTAAGGGCLHARAA